MSNLVKIMQQNNNISLVTCTNLGIGNSSPNHFTTKDVKFALSLKNKTNQKEVFDNNTINDRFKNYSNVDLHLDIKSPAHKARNTTNQTLTCFFLIMARNVSHVF